ncbi:MAG: hypothetical protein J6A54_04150 [Clostridia bacterium]|nr:hypothetical protein [Clostridia bacterium]
MEIKVLDGSFRLKGIIDSVQSLSYTECLRSAGRLHMKIPFDKELYELLKPPARLLIDSLPFNVEMLRCEKNTIIVTGVGIFDEFRHIYICDPKHQSTTPSHYLSYLASEASFDNVRYVVYGQTEVSESAVELYSWCDSYESIMKRIFHEYDLGYKMIYDDKLEELAFYIVPLHDKAYKGSSVLVVSDERGDYELIESVLDVSDYKNNVELLQWYAHTQIGYRESFDRSGGEPKRSIAMETSIPAKSETDIENGFRAIAGELFAKHSKRQEYKIMPTRELGAELGDIVFFESSRLGQSHGAVLVERETSYGDTGCKKILTLEVDK